MDNNDILRQLGNLIVPDHYDEFKQLIILHPDIDLNSQIFDNNDTLLHIAARQCRLQFVKLLIERGANMHLTNFSLNDVLISVSYRCSLEQNFLKINQCYEIIKYLIGYGANCNVSGSSNKTALAHMCEHHHDALPQDAMDAMKDIITLLLDTGLKQAESSYLKQQAVECARRWKNFDLAVYIRDYQTIPDTKGCYGPEFE